MKLVVFHSKENEYKKIELKHIVILSRYIIYGISWISPSTGAYIDGITNYKLNNFKSCFTLKLFFKIVLIHSIHIILHYLL